MTYGLIPFAVMLGIVTGLIILQPDFGTAILLVSTALVMFFLAGADLLQLAIGSIVTSATLLFLISQSSHASERMRSFVAGMIDPVGLGNYQVRQALIALGFGGVFGRGLGGSLQKHEFLPLAHSDSIFAILGEELGLIGCLVVIALFTTLAYRGFRIALRCPDNYGMVLAAGVTSWLIIEAIINIGVVTASLPLTGIPLPLISTGGSSLVASLAAVGLLISVSRGERGEEKRSHALLDFWRRDSRPRVSKSGDHSGIGRRRKSNNERAS